MIILIHFVVIISGFLYCVSAHGEVYLTGNVELNNASPSKLHRRFYVSGDTGISSAPLDLFFARESHRRSQIETIWKWDFWCQLQAKIGNCSRRHLSYYYDSQLDQCMTFGYSGCGGNENNFQSLVECERHCKGTTYMTLKDTTKSTFCGLQPNVGLCLALIDRFYYDVNAQQCKKFVYGGCGGNQNRFTNVEECQERCVNDESR